MLISRFLQLLFISFSILSVFSTQASVVINNTRVVYLDNSKEVSVKLNNNGNKPVLVQSWIDSGDPDQNPSTIQVPFILTPPINRIDSKQGQTLRIFYTGEELSTTEESIFWLNVLEIPAKNSDLKDKNTLQLAFRTRLKLFFRPSDLQGDANDAGKNLVWDVIGSGLKATNPTPYHVSLTRVSIEINDKSYDSEAVMVYPNKSQIFNFSDLPAIPSGSKIIINYLDDYGATKSFESITQ
ncbi:fimbrial biogenesis chaperone [Vibrio algarum]|uniref:Fimbria/pilus periplasmic chaperone n=1 Tax=Vibrio algarum TaxID=3020714 RepID=A0ABT4YSG7_9VIBR|nr:fimbria/pilus periplasmic chaperone [Vibrio sp. KJ40-1]MDB1124352.1 fimbria/pilus periplasmic chaperone [Vibrio sp. KJ40-1]